MERERGTIAAFEGLGRSGKSSQIVNAESYLKSKGKEVIVTREPGGIESAESIRELIFNLKGKDLINQDHQLALFFAARHLWVENLIKPKSDSGINIITDRTYTSTAAYQGYGEGASRDTILKIADVVMGEYKPNGVVLLDISVETFLKRNRKEGDGGDPFDAQGIEYFEKVINGYREMATQGWGGLNWYVVDGEQSREDVFENVKVCLDKIFNI